ncbi:uncharacterized protein LOC143452400 [Clavelina lepadiformis]|uniref:Uncharacterized protein n=1 Tax=Clavelina lepadiformis TaxID=159417 RepID=A0ABP0GYP3_CLALP
MNYNKFCSDVKEHGGILVEYVYMGTKHRMLGEKSSFTREGFSSFTTTEVSTIVNSKGSDFQFRGEKFTVLENMDGTYDLDDIFTYDSATTSIVYGSYCSHTIIAYSSLAKAQRFMSSHQCRKAVEYGLERFANFTNKPGKKSPDIFKLRRK